MLETFDFLTHSNKYSNAEAFVSGLYTFQKYMQKTPRKMIDNRRGVCYNKKVY